MPRAFVPRMHVGKLPMKFYFRAQDISVSLPGADIAGRLVLVWKRGPRRTTTEPFVVKETLSSVDGSLSRTASTSQDLALICTMFKNAKSGAFEPKSASFSLREETPEGQERKLGTASVDLSSYATPDKSSDPVELSFMEGRIRLKLTLTSHWLKQMAAVDDDEASVSSVGSFASSVGGGAVHSDDDGLSDADTPPPNTKPATFTPARGGAPAMAPPSTPGMAMAPMATPGSTMRERSEAEREAAVERRWAEEAGKEANQAAAEQLRNELAEAREALAKSYSEVKSLKGRVERLTSENRVLRREQRGGKRDEVVLQLETELVVKDQERADMEENLSRAFSGVIAEAHARISQLTAERDKLMVDLEAKSKSGRRR